MSDTDKDKRRAERLDVAKHVLSALVSSDKMTDAVCVQNDTKEFAHIALGLADALIAAVDKETPDA